MKKSTSFTRFATRTLVAGCISVGMAAAAAEDTTTTGSTGDDTVTDPVVTTGDDTVTDPGVETSSIGRSTNVESKLTAEFSKFLGGEENAAKVVEGLRTGKAFELDEVEHTEDGGDATTTGAVTTADTGTQNGGADTTPETPTDLPTGTMGYGNVRLTLRLAQAEFDRLGIDRPPTNEELSAMLLGGEINGAEGIAVYEGILNQRAAGEGWGQIAKSYDFKVGQLMGNAPAKQPAVEPLPEPGVQETTATATRSNGYIPSGKTKYTYRDSTGNAAPRSKSQGAKANGYIPSGGDGGSGIAANRGTDSTKVRGNAAKQNGYIPSGKSQGYGSGVMSAHGGAATQAKGGNGQSKGQMKGYVPSGAGGSGLGVVSANNASATASISAAGGHGKGHAKGHGKGK